MVLILCPKHGFRSLWIILKKSRCLLLVSFFQDAEAAFIFTKEGYITMDGNTITFIISQIKYSTQFLLYFVGVLNVYPCLLCR